MTDKLVKLLFTEKSCRSEILHLDDAWQNMSANLNLPTCVKTMLGEMTAGAVMLAASLKFDGSLILQLQGDGPVKLAIVEVRTGLIVRCTAQLRVPVDAVAPKADFKSLVNANGNGRCAMILDMKGRAAGEQPYQGVVPLTGNTVAETIESYMTQSEQIRTRLWLCANNITCGGVLLQHVASHGGNESDKPVDAEGFDHLAVFAQTVKDEELLELDASELARRLFWEDNPVVLEEMHPTFACRCSRQGIESMIRNLGQAEAEGIIHESGKIEVTCEFCGSRYIFDAIDVQTIFADKAFSTATSKAKN